MMARESGKGAHESRAVQKLGAARRLVVEDILRLRLARDSSCCP